MRTGIASLIGREGRWAKWSDGELKVRLLGHLEGVDLFGGDGEQVLGTLEVMDCKERGREGIEGVLGLLGMLEVPEMQ